MFCAIFVIQHSQDNAKNGFLAKARETGRHFTQLEKMAKDQTDLFTQEIKNVREVLRIERAARNEAQNKARIFNFVWGLLGLGLGVLLDGYYKLSRIGGQREAKDARSRDGERD